MRILFLNIYHKTKASNILSLIHPPVCEFSRYSRVWCPLLLSTTTMYSVVKIEEQITEFLFLAARKIDTHENCVCVFSFLREKCLFVMNFRIGRCAIAADE